jgi:hypothetical protein
MKAWFRLDVGTSDGKMYDVTDNVMVTGHEGVSLEEHADLLDKLVFTLRSTDTVSVLRFIDGLAIGSPVRFWFGYGDGLRRFNDSEEMFSGYVGRLQPKYPKTGYPQLEVIAFDPAWLLTQNKPSVQKTWPGVIGEKWTYEDLVRNVMKPYAGKIDIGRIEIPAAYQNIVFDEKHVAVQKGDESDWKFLKRLAFDEYEETSLYSGKLQNVVNIGCECMTYVEYKNGKALMYFVPESDKTKEVSGVEFFYPMHETKIPLTQDVTAASTKMIPEEIKIDDDPYTASEVVVQVPADAFRDSLTPEQVQIVNAGGGFNVDYETFVESFEIDHDLIAADESAGLIKWGVSEYDSGKVGWDEVKKYVRLRIVHVPAGSQAAKAEVPVTTEDLKDPVKRATFLANKTGKRKKKRRTAGFKMTIDLVAGNYNIRPRKTYPVTNIGGRYSTDDKKGVKWFCEEVIHKVGEKYSQTIKLTM